MTTSGFSPEMMIGGMVAGGLLIMLFLYLISTLFQALFIQMGLKWVCRLGVPFSSAFVTAICISALGFLVSLAASSIRDNQLAIGGSGLLVSIVVGTVLISKRHGVSLTDGLLVELISIALSVLMSIASMVMIGLVIFLVMMGMRAM
ncbi:hypothetical protein [Lacunimicrobium album]